MSKTHRTLFNWSTGKDSAFALYELLQDQRFDVGHLLTTVNANLDRVSMHGLRRTLLEKQLAALQLPSSTVELPAQPDMLEYEKLMQEALNPLKSDGYSHAAFGDIFLEDLRKYREDKLKLVGLEAVFPLWKRNTTTLLQQFIAKGFEAVVVCANADLLDESFLGRQLDEAFVKDLPANVDPCGENGEFHTFCFNGPIFDHPIDYQLGEKVIRHYPSPKGGKEESVAFGFIDLLPAPDSF